MCDQCDSLYGNTFKPGDYVLVERGQGCPEGQGRVLSVEGTQVEVSLNGHTYWVHFPWLIKMKPPTQ